MKLFDSPDGSLCDEEDNPENIGLSKSDGDQTKLWGAVSRSSISPLIQTGLQHTAALFHGEYIKCAR